MSLKAEGNQRRKLKVLACAYACVLESGSPVSGGEAVLGWNLARQLARFHDVWVLTATSNRPGIEAELQRRPVPNLTFHYVDLPGWMRPLLRFPGGTPVVRLPLADPRLLRGPETPPTRLSLTFSTTLLLPTIGWRATSGRCCPFLSCEGRAGERIAPPEGFLREYSFGARFWERFRSSGQWVLRRDPFFVRSQRRARVILLCNREAAEAVPKALRHKVQLFPVNGISAEDLRIIGGENGRQGQERRTRA